MVSSPRSTHVCRIVIALSVLAACDASTDTATIRDDGLVVDTESDATGAGDTGDDDVTPSNKDSEGAGDTALEDTSSPSDIDQPNPDAEPLGDTTTVLDAAHEDVEDLDDIDDDVTPPIDADDTLTSEDTTPDDAGAPLTCAELLAPCPTTTPSVVAAVCAEVDLAPVCVAVFTEALAGGCGEACDGVWLTSAAVDALCAGACATALSVLQATALEGIDVCSACLPCAPDCTDRECGPDGCGGTCGTCSEGESCSEDGTCAPDCTPAEELCNGVDDDCDGATDEEVATVGTSCQVEGTGTCALGTWQCNGLGLVCQVTPPMPEVCDGLDNDCNGLEDDLAEIGEECDTGQNGVCQFGLTGCDGGSLACTPQVTQGQLAETCNGLDDDCDGDTDENVEGLGMSCSASGFGQCAQGTTTCKSGEVKCVPSAPSPETCNGLDDNCDGNADDGNPGGGIQCNTGFLGLCSAGFTLCGGESGVTCQANVTPGLLPEACNGLDDDCDGSVDDGIVQVGQPCTRPGFLGICQFGTYVCPTSPPYQLQCSAPLPGTVQEACNNKDDDCNGTIDDPALVNGQPCMTAFPGVCSTGTSQCVGGSSSCSPIVVPGQKSEICNGDDDNCNGQSDEANPTTMCGTANPSASAVSTWVCSSGQCAISACQGSAANFDASTQNGCECMTGGAATCVQASAVSVPLQAVFAVLQTYEHPVAPVSAGDVAWYAFHLASNAIFLTPVTTEIIGSDDFVIEAWLDCNLIATPVSGAQGSNSVAVFAEQSIIIKVTRKATAANSCATPTLRIKYGTN